MKSACSTPARSQRSCTVSLVASVKSVSGETGVPRRGIVVVRFPEQGGHADSDRIFAPGADWSRRRCHVANWHVVSLERFSFPSLRKDMRHVQEARAPSNPCRGSGRQPGARKAAGVVRSQKKLRCTSFCDFVPKLYHCTISKVVVRDCGFRGRKRFLAHGVRRSRPYDTEFLLCR